MFYSVQMYRSVRHLPGLEPHNRGGEEPSPSRRRVKSLEVV